MLKPDVSPLEAITIIRLGSQPPCLRLLAQDSESVSLHVRSVFIERGSTFTALGSLFCLFCARNNQLSGNAPNLK